MVLAALVLASRAAQQPQLRLSLALGLVVYTAIVTRYVGVVLLPAAALAVLVPLRSWNDRTRHLAVLVASSALPVAAWLVRNVTVASTLTGNRAGRHAGLPERGRQIVAVTTRWLMPLPQTGRSVAVAGGLVLLCAAAAVLVLACLLPATVTIRLDPTRSRHPSVARYNSTTWHQHPAVVAARRAPIPAMADIVSNRAYGIGYVLGRAVQESPDVPGHFAIRDVVTVDELTERLAIGAEIYLVWVTPDRGHVPPARLPGLRAQVIEVTPAGGVYRLTLACSSLE